MRRTLFVEEGTFLLQGNALRFPKRGRNLLATHGPSFSRSDWKEPQGICRRYTDQVGQGRRSHCRREGDLLEPTQGMPLLEGQEVRIWGHPRAFPRLLGDP